MRLLIFVLICVLAYCIGHAVSVWLGEYDR